MGKNSKQRRQATVEELSWAKEYMDLLSDMGYEHIRGYLWYVFNNELEEIE